MKFYFLSLVSMLSVSAGAAELKPGDKLPELKGEFLTGREAVLPAAASGKIAVLAIGFSYDSRFPVEAWIKRFRGEFGSTPRATFYEIPMIGGMGVMGKWFIDGGMRKGTPKADQENVITVYGGSVKAWKERVAVHQDNIAYVVLIDAGGVVRWRYNGMFDEAAYKDLAARAKELLSGAFGNNPPHEPGIK